ncbi:MAG TPA: PrsW family intramembrane metalloprotease, partial [Minicystis sp.]|nr:PrsW family intramembrane metalloprotease [Minicystis sp.]
MNNPYGPPGGGGYGQPPRPSYPQPPSYPQAAQSAQGTGYGMPPYMQPPPAAVALPNPERTRRVVGAVLFSVLVLVGLALNVFFYLSSIFLSKHPDRALEAVFVGGALALFAVLFYIPLPAIIDRFDPEPWWCLAMAFVWGAVVATGFAGLFNTLIGDVVTGVLGKKLGLLVTVSCVAPFCEEFFKGLAVLGAFYFLRREFDGVVDGIIYATFTALGFACIENVQYYAHAQAAHALTFTFLLRGVLAPWGHPLYTSMTGIGFGVSRESDSPVVRVLAPIVGYLGGVTLHAIWNFVPTALSMAGYPALFFPVLALWLLFVAAFFVIILVLVARKGRVIRDHLKDEVLLGNLSQDEVELICSPVGRLRCTFSWRGATGRKFIAAGARLALSKWHTARAMRGSKKTVSADFIVPM